MESSTFLLRGALIAFSIAAPVGPIDVRCIHRTLAEGRATGFVSGLGAATAFECVQNVIVGSNRQTLRRPLPEAHLADNDSDHFFVQLGDLVITRPTGTNVNGWLFILVNGE